jgi:hypothetical protein
VEECTLAAARRELGNAVAVKISDGHSALLVVLSLCVY